MQNRYYWLGGICALLLSSPAQAEFVLSEMIIDFPEKAARQHDVDVISRDKETLYIATETYVVEHPATPDEKRTLVTDPTKSGLMITPNKMVLPAQARKLIRLLLLNPPSDKEQIYRVVVKPVIQGVDETQKRVALKVLVGYEALVMVRPQTAKIEVTAERKGNSLTLTNKGNTNANLQAGKQCDATGINCKDINLTRLYAGATWTTTLPYIDGAVKYQVWDGANMTDMTF